MRLIELSIALFCLECASFLSVYGLRTRIDSMRRAKSWLTSANFKIFTGDSTKASSYHFIQEKADILITDPPYCLLNRRRAKGDLRDVKKNVHSKKIDGDEAVTRYENLREYTDFTRQWLSICVTQLKPDAKLIIWTNALGIKPIKDVCTELGYSFLGEFEWAKRTKDLAENSTRNEVLLRVYESALIFQRSIPFASPAPIDRSIPWSVITGYHDEGASMSHQHPCHKPLPALLPLILVWTKPGDVILDPFAGSGSILLAGLKEGRRVVGLEILPRWSQYIEQTLKEISLR